MYVEIYEASATTFLKLSNIYLKIKAFYITENRTIKFYPRHMQSFRFGTWHPYSAVKEAHNENAVTSNLIYMYTYIHTHRALALKMQCSHVNTMSS